MRVCILIVIVLIFFVGGFLLSDQLYYKAIVRDNKLKTPLDVYYWVKSNNPSAINTSTKPASYASPKFNIVNKRKLYCDEGAIVMATLDNEIGYKTRLVDLIGLDSISHHTILEVYENNTWIKYDHFNSLYNKSYKTCAGYQLLNTSIKQYPKTYNFIVNYNFFLKKLAFFLRNIKEEEFH